MPCFDPLSLCEPSSQQKLACAPLDHEPVTLLSEVSVVRSGSVRLVRGNGVHPVLLLCLCGAGRNRIPGAT